MGREPTSAGCHTCRCRHIKCDRERPACGQCRKSNHTCLGYDKLLRVETHGVARDKRSGSTRLVKLSSANSYAPQGVTAHSQGGRFRKDRPSSQVVQICPEIDLAAFADNIALTYLFDAYGWINVHSIFLQDTPMRQHFAKGHDELGYNSLRALAYGIFGRDHHLSNLRREAARIYGRVLQQLASKVASPSKAELRWLIKPIAVIGSYSSAVDDDRSFVHHHGLSRILQHCGPEQFQDTSILPLFESSRFTLLASSMVRRQQTFLAQERWKKVPWILDPKAKSSKSHLLDIMTDIPGIMKGLDDILETRISRTVGYSAIPRQEHGDAVARLQEQLGAVSKSLVSWRQRLTSESGLASDEILRWALFRTGDDVVRPGIQGVRGPDVYGLNLGSGNDLTIPFQAVDVDFAEPVPNVKTFLMMEEAAFYITGLILVGRLSKTLAGAASSMDNIDFYNTPFFTRCECYHNSSGPSRACQLTPPSNNCDSTLSWNVNSLLITECPVRSICHRSRETEQTAPEGDPKLESEDLALEYNANLLLPGDTRFAAQLRILKWLTAGLPDSRAYVLGTLAAMGLTHCAHDVRPLEGNEHIAKTIRTTMSESSFEEAKRLLLRKYR